VKACYIQGPALAYYRHPDWLGTSRVVSTPSRTIYFSGAYAPYGEDYAKSGTTDLSFTGQNQDTTNGLYDFLYRRYNPVHGRWMSPDPAGKAGADSSNPQSWNRYAYVGNMPLTTTDPDGRMWVECGLSAEFSNSCGDGSWWGWRWIEIGIGIGEGVHGIGGGGGGGGIGTRSSGGQYPNSPGIHGTYPNGETLGIPNGFPWRPGSVWSVFLPLGTQCEFGPCLTISDNLLPGDMAVEPVLIQLESDVVKELLMTALVAVRNFVRSPGIDSGGFDKEHLFGTHWCGPGGGGEPINAVDAACMAHDLCYNAAGLSAADVQKVLPPDKAAAIQACNQKLCDASRATNTPSGRLIDQYFSTQVRYRCH
jgi:RHS repeat-associated protein